MCCAFDNRCVLGFLFHISFDCVCVFSYIFLLIDYLCVLQHISVARCCCFASPFTLIFVFTFGFIENLFLYLIFTLLVVLTFVCLFVDPKKRPSLSAISQRLSVLIEKYTQSENVRAHLQEALEKRETQALVASAAIKSAEGEDGEDDDYH